MARLISTALQQGRNPHAKPNMPQPPIEPRVFAKSVGQDPTLGPKWCNEQAPTTPSYIPLILDGLFGHNAAFAHERDELDHWLHIANRRPRPRAVGPSREEGKSLGDYVHPVILTVNQRIPDNQGNLRIPFTLRFQNDEGWKFPARIDGKDVVLTLDIGLHRALFSVTSTVWQPAPDSAFRIPHQADDQVMEGPYADALWINGPKLGPVLSGHPFAPTQDDEDATPLVRATFERRPDLPPDADGSITFRVHAHVHALCVVVTGPVDLSDRQQDVINAICAEPIRRDSKDRLELANAVVQSPANLTHEP